MVIKSLVAGSAMLFAGASLVAAQDQNPTQGTLGQSGQATSGQTTSGQPASGQLATDPANPTGGQSSQMHHDINYYITECLIDGNREEISLAHIALTKATDPEVKQFAQRMIQDHTQFLNKLQNAQGVTTGQQNGDQSGANQQQTGGQQTTSQQNGDQSNVGTPGANANSTNSQAANPSGDAANAGVGQQGRTNAQGGGARQFLQLQKQVKAQCLQSKTQELSQKEGAHFDKCYMNGLVAAHMKMADELTVYSRSGSDSLQTLCQEGLQKTKQHLEMAKQIANRLDGAAAQAAANRNTNPQGQ